MKILVTGAGSPIGTIVCTELEKEHEVIAWTSGKADLLQPLSEDCVQEAGSADAVLHLAWLRARTTEDAEHRNREMLFTRFLEEAAIPAEKLFMLSSVSGAPDARSSYAQAKYRVATELVEKGGTAIVCGLVTSEPPFGPFALLHKMAGLPVVRPHFNQTCPAVYPVPNDRLAGGIASVLTSGITGERFALCREPVPMNEFLQQLRGTGGLPVPVHSSLLLGVAGMLQGLPPWTLWDKLLTFFYKDAGYLAEMKPIPDWNP